MGGGKALIYIVERNICQVLTTSSQLKSKESDDHTLSVCITQGRDGPQRKQSSLECPRPLEVEDGGMGVGFSLHACQTCQCQFMIWSSQWPCVAQWPLHLIDEVIRPRAVHGHLWHMTNLRLDARWSEPRDHVWLHSAPLNKSEGVGETVSSWVGETSRWDLKELFCCFVFGVFWGEGGAGVLES